MKVIGGSKNVLAKLILVYIYAIEQFVNAQEFTNVNGPIFSIQFSPSSIEDLVEDEEVVIHMNITAVNETSSTYQLQVTADDSEIAIITTQSNFLIPDIDIFQSVESNFTIEGQWLGRSTLSFVFTNGDTSENDQTNPTAYDVAVVRPDRIEDDIFEYALGLIIIINNVGFGCKFDWKIAKSVFSRPLAVIIGVCGQYIVLPLVSVIYLCFTRKNRICLYTSRTYIATKFLVKCEDISWLILCSLLPILL